MGGLTTRLPAAPQRFVGRKSDRAWVSSALARGGVVVVVGRPGLGKTSLVSVVLAERNCVYVRLSGTELMDEVARALGAKAATVEGVLEAAEDAALTVVIDDLHRAETGDARALLAAVADYAAASRWVGISRTDPMCPAVEGQLLTLPPLSNDALLELAREIAPSLSSRGRARAVAAADGAPGELWRALDRELLAGRDPDPRALETLPDDVRRFVEALALFSRAVPREVASELAPLPDAASLELLGQRGLIHETSSGISLTDGARASAGASGPDASAIASAAARLADEAEPGAAVEAVRLYRLAGHEAEVAPLLERRGAEILDGGLGRELWTALADLEREELARWKLRCAVACGDPRALARARAPGADDLRDRLAWARALRSRGELVAAETEARAIAEAAAASGDAMTAFEAGEVRARALASLDPRAAVAALQALDPPDSGASVLRDARLAAVWSRLDEDNARAAVDRARRALHTVEPRKRAAVVECLAGAVSRLGGLAEAERMIDRELASAEDGAATTLELCYRAAGIALKRAGYERAEELLARLERLGEGGSGRLQRQLAVLEGFRAVARGDYGGLEARLTEELAGAASEEPPGAYAHLAGLIFFVRTLTGVPVTAVIPDDRGAIEGQPVAELLRVRRLTRVGAMEPGLARACAVSSADCETRVLSGLLAAEAWFIEGSFDCALSELASALELAQRHGYASWDFALRQLLCEVYLVAGERTRAARTASELAQVSEANDSRYQKIESELLVMACADTPPDPSVLERIADAIDAAPVAGRRARMLLGGAARTDCVDERVLEAIRKLPGWNDLQQVPSDTAVNAPKGSWHSGWGLDEHRKQVWLTSGETVDFSRWPILWSLLRALAASGGRANKEQLVKRVWNESVYHPLRHDNRLHAAVRKLRHAIEEDPSRPRRVVTTSGGYRLGGFARRMVQR